MWADVFAEEWLVLAKVHCRRKKRVVLSRKKRKWSMHKQWVDQFVRKNGWRRSLQFLLKGRPGMSLTV